MLWCKLDAYDDPKFYMYVTYMVLYHAPKNLPT